MPIRTGVFRSDKRTWMAATGIWRWAGDGEGNEEGKRYRSSHTDWQEIDQRLDCTFRTSASILASPQRHAGFQSIL